MLLVSLCSFFLSFPFYLFLSLQFELRAPVMLCIPIFGKLRILSPSPQKPQSDLSLGYTFPSRESKIVRYSLQDSQLIIEIVEQLVRNLVSSFARQLNKQLETSYVASCEKVIELVEQLDSESASKLDKQLGNEIASQLASQLTSQSNQITNQLAGQGASLRDG